MKELLIPVVLCGGSGTRLWPLSRSCYPKQFVEFDKGTTLFKSTLKRAFTIAKTVRPIIVCNESHRFLVKRDLDELGFSGNIINEPMSRNTAPAIAYAAFEAVKRTPDAVLLVLPSDHAIEGLSAFVKAVEEAVHIAEENFLVTFGIRPTGPETGFGYIETGVPISGTGFYVKQFIEKPDRVKAKAMLDTGGYLWNSGMFVFRADAYLKALEKFSPQIYKYCQDSMDKAERVGDFVTPDEEAVSSCPSNSIDYAVMEKTDKAAVIPLNVMWNDLGAWGALYQIAEKDENNNTISGDVLLKSCTNCYIFGTSRLITAIGMNDIAVVETKDAVLVTPLSRTQEVKDVVAELKKNRRIEAEMSPVVQRPWGTYEVIAKGEHYQSKRIVVNPGGALSLQLHHRRSEHWTIVEGTAEVTVGKDVRSCSKNYAIYIPVGTVHRLINRTDSPVVLIEVQCGDYFGEDDIERLADIYARK